MPRIVTHNIYETLSLRNIFWCSEGACDSRKVLSNSGSEDSCGLLFAVEPISLPVIALHYSTTYLFPLKQGRNCPAGCRRPTHCVVCLLAVAFTKVVRGRNLYCVFTVTSALGSGKHTLILCDCSLPK